MQTDTGMIGPRGVLALLFAALFSVAAKVWLATLGNNFDMESFSVVADAVRNGQAVYAATDRYNYGPVWAYVLAAIRFVQVHLFANDNLGVFHILIATLLSYVDVAIGFALATRFSLGAGLVFLLNPVSMLITGYHSQFDNVAVLLGLTGTLCIFREMPEPKRLRNDLLGAALIGLSLATKHVLIFYPVWLLFRKEIEWRRKLLICGVAYGIFLGAFVPFAFSDTALHGILANVFGYSPFHLTGFLPRLVSLFINARYVDNVLSWIPIFPGFKFVFVASVVATGFMTRRAAGRESVLLYLIAMCVFASQMADQYLAIPLVACAFFMRSWLAWAYMLFATLALLGSPDNISFLPCIEPLARQLDAARLWNWQPISFLFILLIVQTRRTASMSQPK